MRKLLLLSVFLSSSGFASSSGGIGGGGGLAQQTQLLSLKLSRSIYEELKAAVEDHGRADLQINDSTTVTVKLVDDRMVDDAETMIIESAE